MLPSHGHHAFVGDGTDNPCIVNEHEFQLKQLMERRQELSPNEIERIIREGQPQHVPLLIHVFFNNLTEDKKGVISCIRRIAVHSLHWIPVVRQCTMIMPITIFLIEKNKHLFTLDDAILFLLIDTAKETTFSSFGDLVLLLRQLKCDDTSPISFSRSLAQKLCRNGPGHPLQFPKRVAKLGGVLLGVVQYPHHTLDIFTYFCENQFKNEGEESRRALQFMLSNAVMIKPGAAVDWMETYCKIFENTTYIKLLCCVELYPVMKELLMNETLNFFCEFQHYKALLPLIQLACSVIEQTPGLVTKISDGVARDFLKGSVLACKRSYDRLFLDSITTTISTLWKETPIFACSMIGVLQELFLPTSSILFCTHQQTDCTFCPLVLKTLITDNIHYLIQNNDITTFLTVIVQSEAFCNQMDSIPEQNGSSSILQAVQQRLRSYDRTSPIREQIIQALKNHEWKCNSLFVKKIFDVLVSFILPSPEEDLSPLRVYYRAGIFIHSFVDLKICFVALSSFCKTLDRYQIQESEAMFSLILSFQDISENFFTTENLSNEEIIELRGYFNQCRDKIERIKCLIVDLCSNAYMKISADALNRIDNDEDVYIRLIGSLRFRTARKAFEPELWVERMETKQNDWNDCMMLSQWFSDRLGKNIPFPNQEDGGTIESLDADISAFHSLLVPNLMEREELRVLIIFVKYQSRLFLHFMETEAISSSIQNTITFFHTLPQISSEPFPSLIKKYREVFCIIQKHFEREMEVVTHINQWHDFDSFNYQSDVKRVIDEFVDCTSIQDSFIRIKKDMAIFCTDDSLSVMTDLFNDPTKQLQNSHSLINSLTCNLTPEEFGIFEKFFHFQTIEELPFFQWDVKQFQEEMSMARNNLVSNYEYAVNVLQNVEMAYLLLYPFQQLIKKKSKISFDDLCSQMKEVLKKCRGTLHMKLDCFSLVLQKQGEISVWLSSSGSGYDHAAFLQFANSLSQIGIFKSYLSHHMSGPGLHCYYVNEEGQEIYYPNLDQNLRALNALQDSKMDQLDHISSLSKDIHQLRLELERHGHPAFQRNATVYLNQPGECCVSHFQILNNQLTEIHSNWIGSLHAVKTEYPRLKFFNHLQLASLASLFQSFLDNTVRSHMNSILPYLWYCFPGQSKQNSFAEKCTDLLSNLTEWIKNQQTGKKDVSSIDLLYMIGSYTVHVEQQLEIYFEEEDNPSITYMILDGTTYSCDIPMSIEDAMPHPAQLFFCTERSREHLKHFLARILAFPYLFYYLVDVGSLSFDCKELLISWIINQSEGEIPVQIVLLFYGHIGADNFYFLDRREKENQTTMEKNYRYDEHLKTLPSLPKAMYYVGDVGAGKSFTIQRQKKSILIMNIYESFTPNDFIQRWEVEGGRFSHIHFDVSGYSNLPRFNQFLDALLYWGLVLDENTGNMLRISIGITVYIELHLCVEESALFSNMAYSYDDIIKQLSSLDYVGEKGEVMKEMVYGKEHSLCARWVKTFKLLEKANRSHDMATIDSISKLFTVNSLPFDTDRIKRNLAFLTEWLLVSFAISIPTTPLLYNLFLKQLSLRIGQLKKYLIQNPKELVSRVLTLTRIVFIEAARITDPHIGTSFSKVPFLSVLQDNQGLRLVQFSAVRNVEVLPYTDNFLTYTAHDMEACDLESLIASAMNISAPDLASLFVARQYVLSSDFAFKLLFLYERMCMCENVVLIGSAGVGKTELLSIFTQLINQKLQNNPTLLTKEMVKSFAPKSILRSLAECDTLSDFAARLDTSVSFPKERFRKRFNQLFDNIPSISQLPETVSFVELFGEVASSAQHLNFFRVISMHAGITLRTFRDIIADIVSLALSAQKFGATVVAFIDEVNTTSIMAPVVSIITNHQLDGKKLPSNIFWVSAMNPYVASTNGQARGNFTGIQRDILEYNVRPIPISLQQRSILFDKLSRKQEEKFIFSLLEKKHVGVNVLQRDTLTFGILRSQEYFENLDAKNKDIMLTVSIRDIIRVADLYSFFAAHSFLIPCYDEVPALEKHWKLLLLSLGMVYMFRLVDRKATEEYESLLFSGLKNFGTGASFKAHSMKNICDDCANHLFTESRVPPEIVRTRGLVQNLWCVVVCSCAVIPLIIIGPPGCSKTLSFTIAVENMDGANPTELYRKLCKLDPIRYQCTMQSTDAEIQDRYERAIIQQRLFNSGTGRRTQCVVLLDEAGLPKDVPLKVIHGYLDHPKVGTVILSNVTLDRAKMNRSLQVFQNETSPRDIQALARGAIFPGIQEITTFQDDVIKHLCTAYHRTLSEEFFDPTIPGNKCIFQLRDFIFFLRYLKVHQLSEQRFLSSTLLCHALEQNFNGVDVMAFRKITRMWFTEVNRALEKHDRILLEYPTDGTFTSTVDLIRQNLDFRSPSHSDVNTEAHRYMLLIDPSENETSIGLLESLKIAITAPRKAVIQTTAPIPVSRLRGFDDIIMVEEVIVTKAFLADQTWNTNLILPMKIGTKVNVRNQSLGLPGWWEGEVDGRIGIFPCEYTSITKTRGPFSEKLYTPTLYDEMKEQCDITEEQVQLHRRKYYQPNEALPICIGDYENDQKVEQVTKAVNQVVLAMKDGRTVLLINSRDMDGCFYDLFNRHVKHIGEKSYTNVAVGIYSRQSVVHRDFKVIVHVPLSELDTIPLPYLNRFELYRLTVEDALRDKQKMREWKMFERDGVSVSVVDLILEKSILFAETISSMLFGFLPRETVASILLAALHATDPSEMFPAIPVPFMIQNNDKSIFEEIVLYNEGYSDRDKLVNLIRNVNFRILQLARPDLFFLHSLRTSCYVHQYFANQDHFSAFRVMEHVIERHTENIAAEGSLLVPQKWCISTRTTGELQQLRSKISLFINDKLTSASPVFALQALQSNKDVESKVKFAFKNNNTLICTADMSVCSCNQVNLLKRKIDEFILPHQLAFVILHYKPIEILTKSKKAYQAIFLNKWEFYYCDTIGISSTPNEELKEEMDSRSWIAKAFGMKVKKLAQPSIFLPQIPKLIRRYFMRTTVSFSDDIPDGAKSLYIKPREKQIKAVQQFFDLEGRGACLLQPFLSLFVSQWNADYLHDIVMKACEEIIGGRIGSFTTVISHSLESLLYKACKEFLDHFFVKFQLCHLHNAGTKSERDVTMIQSIYEKSFCLVPKVSHNIERSLVAVLNEEVTIIQLPKKLSRTPMFHACHKFMLNNMKFIMNGDLHSGPKNILLSLIAFLENDNSVLIELLSLYQKNVMKEYVLDLLDEYCHFSEASEELRSTIAMLMISISRNMLNSVLSANSAGFSLFAAVYVCVMDLDNISVYFRNFLGPIIQCNSQEQDIIDLEEVRWDSSEEEIREDIELSVLFVGLQYLWKNFISLIYRGDTTADKIQTWMSAMRLFHYRAESSGNNLLSFASLKRKTKNVQNADRDVHQYIILLTCYLLFENEDGPDTYINILRGYNLAEMKTIHASSLLEIAMKFITNCGLLSLIAEKATFFQRLVLGVTRGMDFDDAIAINSIHSVILLCNNYFHSECKDFQQQWNQSVSFIWFAEFMRPYPLTSFEIEASIAIATRFKGIPYEFEFKGLVQDHPNQILRNFPKLDYLMFFFYLEEISKLPNLDAKFNEFQRLRESKSTRNRVLWLIEMNALAYDIIRSVSTISILDDVMANPNQLVILVELMRPECTFTHGSIQNFFLQQFTQASLIKITNIRNRYESELKLKIPKVAQEVNRKPQLSRFSRFIFTLDASDTPEAVSYQYLKKLVIKNNLKELQEYITRQVTQQGQLYLLRKHLLLVGFIEFFEEKDSKCDILLKLVTTHAAVLQITPDEMEAYRFIYNGPQNDRHNAYFQSGGERDRSTAALMVNMLAVCLGMPPTKTHFYPIIFRLPELCEKKIPGSAYHHNFYDCGFKANQNGKLAEALDYTIMNEHHAHRCVLNFYVWGSIVWRSLLFRNTFVQDVHTCSSLMNYWEDEVGTPLEKKWRYALNRAGTFLSLAVADENWYDKKIDPILIISESLDRIDANHVSMRDIFREKAHCTPYENYFQSIFKSVENDYKTLRSRYTTLSASPFLQELQKIQDLQSNFLLSPFSSISHYQDFKSNQGGAKGEGEETAAELLSKNCQRLDLLTFVPFFVHFYLRFYDILHRRVSHEAFMKPLPTLFVDMKAAALITPAEAAELSTLLEEYIKFFDHVSEKIGEVQFECQTTKLPLFTDNHGALTLDNIMSTETEGQQDATILLLKSLMAFQEVILREVEHANLSTGDLSTLAYQRSSLFSLIHVKGTINNWYEHNVFLNKRENEEKSLLQVRNSVSFCEPSIESACRTLVEGIPSYDVSSFRKILEPLKKKETHFWLKSSSRSLASIPPTMLSNVYEMDGSILSRFNFQIYYVPEARRGLEKKISSRKRKVIFSLAKKPGFTQDDIEVSIENTYYILMLLQAKKLSKEELEEKVDSFATRAKTEWLANTKFHESTKSIVVNQIYSFCSVLVDIYHARPWEISAPLHALALPLTDDQNVELLSIRNRMIKEISLDGVMDHINKLRDFYTTLQETERYRRFLDTYSLSLRSKIDEDHSISQTLREEGFVEPLLPISLKTGNLPAFLLWLSGTIGILLSHYEIRKNRQHNDIYSEMDGYEASLPNVPLHGHVADARVVFDGLDDDSNGWFASLLHCLASDNQFVKSLLVKENHPIAFLLKNMLKELLVPSQKRLQVSQLLGMFQEGRKDVQLASPFDWYENALCKTLLDELEGTMARKLLARQVTKTLRYQWNGCGHTEDRDVTMIRLLVPDCLTSIRRVLEEYLLEDSESCSLCSSSSSSSQRCLLTKKFVIGKNDNRFTIPIGLVKRAGGNSLADLFGRFDFAPFLAVLPGNSAAGSYASIFSVVHSLGSAVPSRYSASVKRGDAWFSADGPAIQGVDSDSIESSNVVLLFLQVFVQQNAIVEKPPSPVAPTPLTNSSLAPYSSFLPFESDMAPIDSYSREYSSNAPFSDPQPSLAASLWGTTITTPVKETIPSFSDNQGQGKECEACGEFVTGSECEACGEPIIY